MMEKLLRIDFHSHTIWSDDSLLMPADLVKAARKKGLDKIVVTDHNAIGGALEAQKLAPDLVIVGEEVMTTTGEILAAYVQELIPSGLTPLEALKRLRDQGAFIGLSHPFDRHRLGGWTLVELEGMLSYLDALETLNARTIHAEDNQRAVDFALAHHLSAIAGSDSHAGSEVATAWLEVPSFSDAASLRNAVKYGRICGARSPFWVHYYSSWARLRKKWLRP